MSKSYKEECRDRYAYNCERLRNIRMDVRSDMGAIKEYLSFITELLIKIDYEISLKE